MTVAELRALLDGIPDRCLVYVQVNDEPAFPRTYRVIERVDRGIPVVTIVVSDQGD
jgi:hypothetical protein